MHFFFFLVPSPTLQHSLWKGCFTVGLRCGRRQGDRPKVEKKMRGSTRRTVSYFHGVLVKVSSALYLHPGFFLRVYVGCTRSTAFYSLSSLYPSWPCNLRYTAFQNWLRRERKCYASVSTEVLTKNTRDGSLEGVGMYSRKQDLWSSFDMIVGVFFGTYRRLN